MGSASLTHPTPATPAVIFVAIYALYVCYNLNLFYIHGSAGDPGWFAWLTSNVFVWPAPDPQSIGGSFFSQHLSLIFFITSDLLLPFAAVPYAVKFCFVFALWLPLFWVAMMLLLGRFDHLSWPVRHALAILLTLNGLNFSMLGFPHIESFIPALAILGLAVWLRRADRFGFILGLGCIVAALLFREDAGLHLFLALAALIACAFLSGARTYRRGLWALAVLCALYSAAALVVQTFLVPGGAGQLGVVYLGHPPFASVTLHGVGLRLIYWLTRRAYIFLPLLILVGAAVAPGRCQWRLLFGAAIMCPWLALSLVAVTPGTGELYDYYCFPLMFGFFWPLLLAQIDSGRAARLLRVQLAMGAVSAGVFIVTGILPFTGDGSSHDKAPWLHLMPAGPGLIARTQSLIAASGLVLMDNGASALALGPMQAFQHRQAEKFTPADVAQARGYLRFVTAPAPFLADRTAMLAAAFPVCTPLAGTYLEMCRRGNEAAAQ